MNSFFEGIMEGLIEALAYAKGEPDGNPDFTGCATEKEPKLRKTEAVAEQDKAVLAE